MHYYLHNHPSFYKLGHSFSKGVIFAKISQRNCFVDFAFFIKTQFKILKSLKWQLRFKANINKTFLFFQQCLIQVFKSHLCDSSERKTLVDLFGVFFHDS